MKGSAGAQATRRLLSPRRYPRAPLPVNAPTAGTLETLPGIGRERPRGAIHRAQVAPGAGCDVVVVGAINADEVGAARPTTAFGGLPQTPQLVRPPPAG